MAQSSVELPSFLKRGVPARLIPSVADSSKEQRITSALLATMMSVDDFGHNLLRMVGAPATKRARIQCFTEVVFRDTKGDKSFRPDGLIVVDNGRHTWSAIVEAKVGNTELDTKQVRDYLEIARDHGMDAVITISNQFAALPTHHPVPVDRRKVRSVTPYHWSWMSVMTEAALLADHGGIEHRGRAFILTELLRYLRDSGSGVVTAVRMSSNWREVCLAVLQGVKLSKNEEKVVGAVGDWQQMLRFLSLKLGGTLACSVPVRMSRRHMQDPTARLNDTVAELVDTQRLEAEFEIPDAASRLGICVDLRRRTLTASMRLKAPDDKIRASACVTWLMRELAKCDDPEIVIRAVWPGRAADTLTSLATLREDRTAILTENKTLLPVAFEVRKEEDVAARIKGAVTFGEDTWKLLEAFYTGVGQHLKPWVPAPPKVAPKTEPDERRRSEAERVPEREQQPVRSAVAGAALMPPGGLEPQSGSV